MGAKRVIPSTVGGAGLILMEAVAVSSTSTVNSPVYNANFSDNIGIQISFVGTMTGTLSVQCSVDNVNFIALTFNPVLSQPAGSNLSYLIDINQLPFPYIRVSYTNASGSGTLSASLSSKDLN